MGTIKGFKVTDAERKVRVGIAARTLEDLRAKTKNKFKLKLPNKQITFLTPDGTVVGSDDYLGTLQAQSLLIWVEEGATAETDAELLYKSIREVNEAYLTAGQRVQEFFTERMKSKVYKLAEVLRNIDEDRAKLNTAAEDPMWFEGLDSRAKTKEDYMFRRAQDRIRTYYYRTRDELKQRQLSIGAKISPDTTITPYATTTKNFNELLDQLQTRLKHVQYYGCYFDRRHNSPDDLKCHSLCDSAGTFRCQGRWDKLVCLYNERHEINPYGSREARIIFQTWNLDHVTERTRAIIPEVMNALNELVEKEGGDERFLDAGRIFDDLFSVSNLKLVHIVCHDKGAHSTKVAGPYLI